LKSLGVLPGIFKIPDDKRRATKNEQPSCIQDANTFSAMSEENMVPEPFFIKPVPEKTIYLAKWSARFWAWIVDIILVILFLEIVHGVLVNFFDVFPYWDIFHLNPLVLSIGTFIFFFYWTIMEGYQGRGQSIGKMVMNLRVVNRDGTRINYVTAAVESAGKSFFPILIFDCLIGWLAMPGTQLRVFNRISNTIVIKSDYKEPQGILYVRDKE
jgi:uncharacterized RDD family membrane protein YckC